MDSYGLSRENFDNNSLFIQLSVNEFYINYTISLYKKFDGDILLPIILGSIAHHTISVISKKYNYDSKMVMNYLSNSDFDSLLPCNAYSISEYTGIPRETVRRKVAKLIRKGWIKSNNKSEFFLSSSIQGLFSDISYDFASNLIQVASLVKERIKRTQP